jgi:poly-gamma-glutamate capsule biosynthesis protein CapA/YwtB (metallophosphatase superfamily)
MRALACVGFVAGLMLASSARLHAQDHGATPAPARGPVVAPAKPVVAPAMRSGGDAGAQPAAPRSKNAKTISVSARTAAENTIAALVAAMKNMPKRPPEPPESRTPRARRADGTAAARGAAAPTPIVYRVTWPAAPPELGLDRRVELDWHGEPAGAARLRWNTPAPE